MTDYMLEEVDFPNISVLDAAAGAGNTTLKLAGKMAEANGKGKIIIYRLSSIHTQKSPLTGKQRPIHSRDFSNCTSYV